jgi:hypothetical protein
MRIFSNNFNHPVLFKINSNPQSIEVYEGQTATFTASGIGTPIQWQKSTDNGVTWTNISGANSTTYTTPATVRSTDNQNLFRVLFGSAVSFGASLSVWNPLALGSDLGVWLDPSFGLFQERTGASATTTAGNGNPVGTWRAKDGTINGSAGIDSQRPINRTTGLNNTPCVEFVRSSNNSLVFTTPLQGVFRNRAYGYIFAAISSSTDTTEYMPFGFSINSSGSFARAGIFLNRSNVSGSGALIGRRLDSDSLQTADTQTYFSNNENLIIGGEWLWGKREAYLRKNGSRVGSNTTFQTQGLTSDTNSARVVLGELNGDRYYNGKIGHLVVASPTFEYNQETISKIEGFINYKTGNIY